MHSQWKRTKHQSWPCMWWMVMHTYYRRSQRRWWQGRTRLRRRPTSRGRALDGCAGTQAGESRDGSEPELLCHLFIAGLVHLARRRPGRRESSTPTLLASVLLIDGLLVFETRHFITPLSQLNCWTSNPRNEVHNPKWRDHHWASYNLLRQAHELKYYRHKGQTATLHMENSAAIKWLISVITLPIGDSRYSSPCRASLTLDASVSIITREMPNWAAIFQSFPAAKQFSLESTLQEALVAATSLPHTAIIIPDNIAPSSITRVCKKGSIRVDLEDPLPRLPPGFLLTEIRQ